MINIDKIRYSEKISDPTLVYTIDGVYSVAFRERIPNELYESEIGDELVEELKDKIARRIEKALIKDLDYGLNDEDLDRLELIKGIPTENLRSFSLMWKERNHD